MKVEEKKKKLKKEKELNPAEIKERRGQREASDFT